MFHNKPEQINLFPIYSYKIKFGNLISEKECYQFQKDYPKGEQVTNRGGWQSVNNIHEYFTDFTKKLEHYLDKNFIPDGLEKGEEAPKHKVDHMWLNINKKNDYNTCHDHGLSFVSGVYWIKSPKTGRFFFENPNLVQVIQGRESNHFPDYSVTYVENKEQHICLFPSWIRHGVEPNLTDETRISISFNINRNWDKNW